MANIETFAKSGLRNLFLVLIAFSIFIDTSDHIGIVVKIGWTTGAHIDEC